MLNGCPASAPKTGPRCNGRWTSLDPGVADDGPGPFARSATRERVRRLRADLEALDTAPRTALLLRELAGMSHQEIAAALGAGADAAVAKRLIREAREALHDLALGRDTPCPDIRRTISDGDGRVLRSRRMRSHLRDCAECSSFRAAIGSRAHDLAALAAVDIMVVKDSTDGQVFHVGIEWVAVALCAALTAWNAVVEQGRDQLHVRLGLDESAHHTERACQAAVTEQHPRDDRVVGALARRQFVWMPRLEAEQRAPTLQEHACPLRNNPSAKACIQAVSQKEKPAFLHGKHQRKK